MIVSARTIITLNNSTARKRGFLISIETERSFSNIFSKLDTLPL